MINSKQLLKEAKTSNEAKRHVLTYLAEMCDQEADYLKTSWDLK